MEESSNSKPRSQQPALQEFPLEGRIAAVDYGTVRIGVAICDPDRILASPLEVIDRKQVADLTSEFNRIATEEKIQGWVVGLPVHLSGDESKKSIEARAFARQIQRATGLPTRLYDERFTTSVADERMSPSNFTNKRRKQRVDAIAAQVLLESFIEACCGDRDLPGYSTESRPDGDKALN